MANSSFGQMWIKNLFLSILFVAGFIFPLFGYGAGIRVSPSRLDFVLQDSDGEKEIIVTNPTNDVQVFEIYADNFEKMIIATPETFTLESGDERSILISVKIPNLRDDEVYQTNLSVISYPLASSRVQAGAGVKIPIEIRVEKDLKNMFWPYYLSGAVILTALFGIWVLVRRKRAVI